MTPAEFHQRYGIDPKTVRAYLRRRWGNHQPHDRWELDATMIADAVAHFGLTGSSRAGATSTAVKPGSGSHAPASGAGTRPSPGLHAAVYQLARAAGIPLSLGRPLPWLSVRGHLEPVVRASADAEILDALATIHRALGGVAAALAAKRAGAGPTPDLIHTPTGCVIEVDEVQHFTTARRSSLDRYPSVRLGFDIDEYRSLIDRWHATGDRAFAHKTSADFPQPGGRQAQRAYNDALRDLLALRFTGYPVIRIPVPDRVITAATIDRLADALDNLH